MTENHAVFYIFHVAEAALAAAPIKTNRYERKGHEKKGAEEKPIGNNSNMYTH